MPKGQDLEKFWKVLEAVGNGPTEVKSVRLPAGMSEALQMAVDLGFAANVNEALVRSTTDDLEFFMQRLALDAHYAEFPELRPSLAELAMAAAELDADPLAERPDLLEIAAEAVVERDANATFEDVLVYASALASKHAS